MFERAHVGAFMVLVSIFVVAILAPWLGRWPAISVGLVLLLAGTTLWVLGDSEEG